jgi:ankyrin repeat protein
LGSLALTAILARYEKAEERSVEILQMLFKAGAKLGPNDDDILYFPVSQGWADFTEILLQHGANPTREIDGKTPMEIAIGAGQDKVVKVLKKHGVQPPDKVFAVQLALMEAVRSCDITKIDEAIRKGAKVNNRNRQGQIALIEAVANPDFSPENYATVQYLLKKGADPKVQGKWYSEETTALHCAIFCSSSIFADKGTNDERRNNARSTIESLLSHGALVSARNSDGMTPLHVAAKANNLVGAKMLLDAGAEVTPKDNKGRTPLDYAASAEMVKLLMDHGAK